MKEVTARLDALLAASAARLPSRVALEDPQDGGTIDYRELHAAADRVCALLRARGVKEGDRVGVSGKSIPVVAAIFGILRAGAAYVPIDASAPLQRGAAILTDCAVRAAFVAAERGGELAAAFGHGHSAAAVRPVDELAGLGPELAIVDGPAAQGPAVAPPPGLAYILYTSGSTGVPKGVVHTHASALAFVDWCSTAFVPTADDRFSSHAPFHFDLSIFDLYVAIKHGAALVLIGDALGKYPVGLAQTIAERRISVWYSTPSILRLLVELGKLEKHAHRPRLVLFAGEVFPLKHLRALQAVWTTPRYCNLYGPTETNVCTWYDLPAQIPEQRSDPFPIGVPCSDDECRVVDEDGRDVARGEEGELWVAGGSVMQGYWNRPERTAEVFVTEQGKRWYRTGDLVREDRDGNYLFVGRRDRMVKRRGYRIELGEIEAALYRHPRISEAAAVAVRDAEGGVEIRAFLAVQDGAAIPALELKQWCAKEVPLYMIPDRFVCRDALPKTSTDKIDYQALLRL
jgi:amino acid adenylation domain-containing protein